MSAEEVSKLYYERKYADAPPNTSIDLSFSAILRDLNIPLSLNTTPSTTR
jgi:DNA polymerase-3 subunit epsilon